MFVKLSRDQIMAAASIPLGHPSPHLDEMAVPSYLHTSMLIRRLMWKRLEFAYELAHIAPTETVLDFGCGIGLLLPSLCSSAASVYAVDKNPDYARSLAASMDLSVVIIQTIDTVDDRSIDVILATDVLEHLEDLDIYIDQFRHKLVPNGRLIVSGPTENFAYKLGRVAIGWPIRAEYHVTDIKQVDSTIRAHGFEEFALRRLPFVFPPLLFLVYGYQNRAN